MLAGLLLDESEDEVALTEREVLDLPVVVVPQALLVDGRTAERQEEAFFEQVDTVFAGFSSFGFGVHRDVRRVELNIGRDDGFGSIDKEERGEPGRPIRRGAETPENGRQLVKLAAE